MFCSWSFSQWMNIFLLLDITAVMKAPFKSKDARIRIYYIWSIALTLLQIPIANGSTKRWLWVLFLNRTFLILVTFYAIVVSCVKLNKQGISPEIRSLFLKRYVSFALAYLVTSAYVYYSIIEQL